MGVRTNNKILRNPFWNLNTVICYSLSISEAPVAKRSLFTPPMHRAMSCKVNNRVQIEKPSSKRFMPFASSNDYDGQYMRRIKLYFDFLFKINYSNRIYVQLELFTPSEDMPLPPKHKVFVGKGNNSLLVKSILKRRFWLEVTDKEESS